MLNLGNVGSMHCAERRTPPEMGGQPGPSEFRAGPNAA